MVVEEFTRECVRQFSQLCQEFFDFERRELLEKSPSPADLEAHRTAVKWLLRSARALLTITSDPDFPDRSIAGELEGRLLQLEHAWRPFQEKEHQMILSQIGWALPENSKPGKNLI